MQMESISVNDIAWNDPPLQTTCTMSDQRVEALGSKIQFLSVMETITPSSPLAMLIFLFLRLHR